MESLWHSTHRIDPSPDVFMPDSRYETVVAGAGLTGLATAVLLARSGQKVAILEADRVGALTTGGTTGKLSLLQGQMLSDIRRFHTDRALRAYVDGNREGFAWLVRYLQERGVPVQRRAAHTYANTRRGLETLRRERVAANLVGLDVEWSGSSELPFPTMGSITLPNQAQFHPLHVLQALVNEFREHGGELFEGVRLTGADSKSPVRVETDRGHVVADRLILATGAPVLDRGLYFAKLLPLRTYLTAFRVPGGIPQDMYLSIDSPSRTLRSVPVDGEELLIVGGNGHVVGRSNSTLEAVNDITSWTSQHFPGAEPIQTWAAQDYRTIGRIPHVGKLPRGGGAIWLATGYNKWGLTNAIAAALSLSCQILGGHMPWVEKLTSRVSMPASILEAVKLNGTVAALLAKGWLGASTRTLPSAPDRRKVGVVGRVGARPVAESEVAGAPCQLSGVCTHMGGILRWNDGERTWDCPLHGSRFDADGKVIEGPAVRDLERIRGTSG